MGSRFLVTTLTGAPIEVVFEPAGVHVDLVPGDRITVEWEGEGLGEIAYGAGVISIWDPQGADGRTRAWTSDGEEIFILG